MLDVTDLKLLREITGHLIGNRKRELSEHINRIFTGQEKHWTLAKVIEWHRRLFQTKGEEEHFCWSLRCPPTC